jgi:hypothetical protein
MDARLGLDMQRVGIRFGPDGDEVDPAKIRVEIVGDPKATRKHPPPNGLH